MRSMPESPPNDVMLWFEMAMALHSYAEEQVQLTVGTRWQLRWRVAADIINEMLHREIDIALKKWPVDAEPVS